MTVERGLAEPAAGDGFGVAGTVAATISEAQLILGFAVALLRALLQVGAFELLDVELGALPPPKYEQPPRSAPINSSMRVRAGMVDLPL